MPRKSTRSLVTPFDFITQHSVFRLEELEAAYREMGRTAKSARRIVEFHIGQGRLLSLRRGLYLHPTSVDPWLLASKLADPVVISHDGALSFHGLTGLGHHLSFMTTARTSGTQYNEVIYAPLRVKKARMVSGVEDFEREGQPLVVTTIPVTLVDCLAVLDRGPSLEDLMEIFQASAKTVDASQMIQHALTFESPLLVARLAYFLTCARFDLGADDKKKLNWNIPRQPTYFLRSARTPKDCSVLKWNIIVPEELYAFWPQNR